MVNVVDTPRSRSPSSPEFISCSSWTFPPRTRLCSPVLVTTKILKRTERGYKDPAVTMAAVRGVTRSGVLMTDDGGLSKIKGVEGRRRWY